MGIWGTVWSIIGIIVIVGIILMTLIPYLERRALLARRLFALRSLERKRASRLITMIHRQETISFLGLPISRYIDIEDSEQILRAIRMTPPEMPLDIVLHTPGGLVLASEQIAFALKRHKGKVTVFVPHYAMSGGTLLALAADEIVMDPDAVLGPVDPQLGSPLSGSYPAASIIEALQEPNPNRDDHILILGDMARKAQVQVYDVVHSLVKDRMPDESAKELAKTLSDGRWTHDYPISAAQAKALGFPVTEGLPREIYDLMDLYPQSGLRRPSVEYVPAPYFPRQAPRRGEAGGAGRGATGNGSWKEMT